ncbi:MAG: hypothetical protein ACJ798_02125 [Phenylobacterium sp.]
MRAELDHIPEGFAAVAFALDCIRASYAQRIEDMATMIFLTRWTLAGAALAWAGFSALAATLAIAIKGHPGLKAAELGDDPGTAETLRFIQAYPAWELALVVVAVGLLAGGAIELVRRRSNALPLLVLGVGIATLLALLDLRLADPGADRPLASTIHFAFPLICLVPVWWLSRRAPDLLAAK